MPPIPKTIDELAAVVASGQVLVSWGVGQTVLAVVAVGPGEVEVWRVIP